MNKDLFTDALSEEMVQELTKNMFIQQKTKKKNFSMAKKIISTAAVFVLLIGFFNIPNVIAFISGLNFVPGIGLTEDNAIIYKGLSEPLDIECDEGTLTFDFVSKISYSGKSNLSLSLYSSNLKSAYNDENPLTFDISTNDKVIASDLKLNVLESRISSDGVDEGYSFFYSYEDFPDIDEFNLTICGETVPISLSKQDNNYVLSEENNDIILAMRKLNNRMMYMDVIDNTVNPDECSVVPDLKSYSFYNENDNEVLLGNSYSGGGPYDSVDALENGSFRNSTYNQLMVLSDYNSADFINREVINRIEVEAIYLDYYKEDPEDIEIPIPEDGETIETDIQVQFGKYIYEIYGVRREGDLLYLDDNCITEIENVVAGGSSMQGSRVDNSPFKGTPDYEEAVLNREAYIDEVTFLPSSDFSHMNSVIVNFDKDAKTLKTEVYSAKVIQYGNFDIDFE